MKNKIKVVNKMVKIIDLNKYQLLREQIVKSALSGNESAQSEHDLKLWKSLKEEVRKLRKLLLTMLLFCQYQKFNNDPWKKDWKKLVTELNGHDELMLQLCFSGFVQNLASKHKQSFVSELIIWLLKLDVDKKSSYNRVVKQLNSSLDYSWQVENALVAHKVGPLLKINGNKSVTEKNITDSANSSFKNLYLQAKIIRANFKRPSSAKSPLTIAKRD